MKPTFTGKMLLGFGFSIILISIIKWYFLRLDYSQLGFGVLIGMGCIALYWVHHRMLHINEDILELNNALDAFRKWADDEFEKIVT